MRPAGSEVPTLQDEHGALLRAYAEVQQRCTRWWQEQQREREVLEGEHLRTRGACVLLRTRLAWAEEALQQVQAAADLVICQTGCISHGGYWRADEHCKRHDRPCLLSTPADSDQSVRQPSHSGSPR